MKYYTQHDISLGKMRLKMGKAVEPELAAAILGYGIKMDGPAGSGGVSVPSLAERAGSPRLPGRATARHILGVLDEVAAERQRQDACWGQQNHPSFPTPLYGIPAYDAEARALYYGVPEESDAKWMCEERFGIGEGTYGDIFIEEVAEAIGAADEDRLREELVQCAAVAVAWIEAIDRRKAQEQKS